MVFDISQMKGKNINNSKFILLFSLEVSKETIWLCLIGYNLHKY